MIKLVLKTILKLVLIAILSINYTCDCFKTANVNLLKVFESHPYYKRYNTYLNRFSKSSNLNLLNKKLKAAKNLELKLSMDIKRSHESYLSKQANLNKEIDKLKLSNQTSLSESLISIGNQSKQNDLEYANTLLAYKKTYTAKLDNILEPIFCSHDSSQLIWNKIINEIRNELESIRVKNNIDVVIQSNPKKYLHGQFFNELDRKLNELSTKLSWLALNQLDVADSMFTYLANTTKTNQFLKLLPTPLDMTSQLIKKVENINE